ncbi:hypothetical protein AB0J63_49405 [Streptosporangium canum]|uniref:hypothetical protein n=1 Tax=Streptosporangium canum TaxID=324952 RepID=UPI003425A446
MVPRPHYGLAVESMRRSGRRIDDEVLAHISPAHSENINFFGSIDVDIEGEPARLGATGYRPLRVLSAPQPTSSPTGPSAGSACSARRPRLWTGRPSSASSAWPGSRST